MFGDYWIWMAKIAELQAKAEQEAVDKARASMTPEQFKEWQAERTAERRHRELCRSIEKAGERARPHGLGMFW